MFVFNIEDILGVLIILIVVGGWLVLTAYTYLEKLLNKFKRSK